MLETVFQFPLHPSLLKYTFKMQSPGRVVFITLIQMFLLLRMGMSS